MKPEPQPGVKARRPDICNRCPEPINPGDRIAFRRGHPIHVTCQSGADDE